MKFRCKMTEKMCIQNLTRVLATISKVSKTCILRVTPVSMYFIVTERAGGGPVAHWCELLQTHFFTEYEMDGATAEHREIYLQVSLDNILRVMKLTQPAKSVKCKLTKKHGASLTFELELPSQILSASRVSVQDIPVKVIPRRLWSEYREPIMPNFHISFCMPSLRILRNIVERMKNLGNHVIVSASNGGELRFMVETDLVTVTTTFKDLEVLHFDGNQDTEVEVRVDVRKFAQFLASQQVNPSKVICNIVQDRMAHFFVVHVDVTLQYIFPSISI